MEKNCIQFKPQQPISGASSQTLQIKANLLPRYKSTFCVNGQIFMTEGLVTYLQIFLAVTS